GFVGTISGGAIFPYGSLSLIWERTRGAGSMESGFFSSILLPQAQAGMVSPNLPPISIVGGGMAPTGGPITPTTSRATLSYSVGVFPSIFLAAVPLLSQTVTVTTAHPLTERLSVTGGANFARNDSTSSGSNISFMSYQGDVSVNYLLTSTLKASAVGAYGHYDQQVMSTAVDFDRQPKKMADRGMYSSIPNNRSGAVPDLTQELHIQHVDHSRESEGSGRLRERCGHRHG